MNFTLLDITRGKANRKVLQISHKVVKSACGN